MAKMASRITNPSGIFLQRYVWRSSDGQVNNINDLHLNHLKNLAIWLEDNFHVIQSLVHQELGVSVKSVKTLPIYQAVAKRIRQLEQQPAMVLTTKGGLTIGEVDRLRALLKEYGLRITVDS